VSRQTLSGVLHASVSPKRRGSFMDQLLIGMLVESGKITYEDRKFFYAPRYYLTDDEQGNPSGLRLLVFKGQPKGLSVGLRGHLVTVKATLEVMNHRGSYLLRPEILAVSDDVVSGHECDSPRACGVKQ
jgi:hypothetical protein